MPRIAFTSNLQRHVSCPTVEVSGETVRAALDQAFESQPKLRGYVLDERGRLRTHMAIFINGKPMKDRENLSDQLVPQSEVYVMQALSGG